MKLESRMERATKQSARRVRGHCLCGAVELEIDFPAFWSWHDHSEASRRAHGAAFLLVTIARLARPGGVRAVAADSLAVKHQLLIMKRSQRRRPNLTAWDRLILGFCT